MRRKLNAMALEFSGKSVLIVDGLLFYPFTKYFIVELSGRFDCTRDDFQRNHTNGKGRRSKKRSLCVLCTSNPVRNCDDEFLIRLFDFGTQIFKCIWN